MWLKRKAGTARFNVLVEAATLEIASDFLNLWVVYQDGFEKGTLKTV